MSVESWQEGCCALFETPLVRIGGSDCHPHSDSFHAPGPVTHHSFLFPWRSVWVEHEQERPFLADPGVVTFYNDGDEVHRRAANPDGDRYACFQIRTAELLEVTARFDPAAEDRPDQPFTWTSAPTNSRAYLVHRSLVQLVESAECPDALEIEETTLALLEHVLSAAAGVDDRPSPRRSQFDLVQHTRALMAEQPGRWSLDELATRAGCSAPHLSRTFTAVMSQRLTTYRNHLRLCAALQRLEDPTVDLTSLALDLGFHSHSHMTSTFTQCFGTTPSQLRRGMSLRRLRSLREDLQRRTAV